MRLCHGCVVTELPAEAPCQDTSLISLLFVVLVHMVKGSTCLLHYFHCAVTPSDFSPCPFSVHNSLACPLTPTTFLGGFLFLPCSIDPPLRLVILFFIIERAQQLRPVDVITYSNSGETFPFGYSRALFKKARGREISAVIK